MLLICPAYVQCWTQSQVFSGKLCMDLWTQSITSCCYCLGAYILEPDKEQVFPKYL